jgi:uncharacterized protein (UPF0248 family)
VRDTLNKIRWTGRLDEYRLTVKDRVSGVKEILGASITRIGKRDFDSGDSTIPFYKVLSIYTLDSRVYWKRPK